MRAATQAERTNTSGDDDQAIIGRTTSYHPRAGPGALSPVYRPGDFPLRYLGGLCSIFGLCRDRLICGKPYEKNRMD